MHSRRIKCAACGKSYSVDEYIATTNCLIECPYCLNILEVLSNGKTVDYLPYLRSNWKPREKTGRFSTPEKDTISVIQIERIKDE